MSMKKAQMSLLGKLFAVMALLTVLIVGVIGPLGGYLSCVGDTLFEGGVCKETQQTMEEYRSEFDKFINKEDYTFEEFQKTGQELCNEFDKCFGQEFSASYKEEFIDKIKSLNKKQRVRQTIEIYTVYDTCFSDKLPDDVLLLVANAYYEIYSTCDSLSCIEGLTKSIEIYKDVLSRNPDDKKELSYKILQPSFARPALLFFEPVSDESVADSTARKNKWMNIRWDSITHIENILPEKIEFKDGVMGPEETKAWDSIRKIILSIETAMKYREYKPSESLNAKYEKYFFNKAWNGKSISQQVQDKSVAASKTASGPDYDFESAKAWREECCKYSSTYPCDQAMEQLRKYEPYDLSPPGTNSAKFEKEALHLGYCHGNIWFARNNFKFAEIYYATTVEQQEKYATYEYLKLRIEKLNEIVNIKLFEKDKGKAECEFYSGECFDDECPSGYVEESSLGACYKTTQKCCKKQIEVKFQLVECQKDAAECLPESSCAEESKITGTVCEENEGEICCKKAGKENICDHRDGILPNHDDCDCDGDGETGGLYDCSGTNVICLDINPTETKDFRCYEPLKVPKIKCAISTSTNDRQNIAECDCNMDNEIDIDFSEYSENKYMGDCGTLGKSELIGYCLENKKCYKEPHCTNTVTSSCRCYSATTFEICSESQTCTGGTCT